MRNNFSEKLLNITKKKSMKTGASEDLIDRIYTSRLLGQNPNLVLHGGGNTSVKSKKRDLDGIFHNVIFVKGSGSDLSTIQEKDFPAVNMTHYAASKFCEWLSSKTGYYYRLPTEAEWEYACSEDMDNLIINDFSWNSSNSEGKYQKVGQKKPNGFGLHDMLGNVAEWTADVYEKNTYKKMRKKNPFKSGDSKYPRVIRGGSWEDNPSNLKRYYRDFSTKDLQKRDPQIPKSLWWNTDAPNIGFRIVRPLNNESEKLKRMFWNYSD